MKVLVKAALSKNGLPPPPAYYPRPVRPTPCVKRTAIRILVLEAAMYPEKETTLKLICRNDWGYWAILEYNSMVSSAYSKAERLITGAGRGILLSF